MKVLIITSVYPTLSNPYSGLYVKEQIDSIKLKYSNVKFDVYYIDHYKGKFEYIKSIINVNSLIRNNNYDVIHIHYGIAGLFLLNPFKHKTPPVVVTFHGSDIQPNGGNGKLSEYISKTIAKRANAVIVLNNTMSKIVSKYNANRLIIPCSVNLKIFRKKYHNQNKKPIIIFPSNRTRAVKNYALFRQVLDILKKEYGLDPIEREIKNMSREQVADLFSNADLLLMTSKSEGSPQVIKEAMACDLPCVSTPVGDVNVLLDGVKDSYVSKEHSASELAALSYQSLKRKGKGISGREKCIKLGIDSDNIAIRIYNLYQEIR